MTINNLFAGNNETVSTNGRALTGTAQLTNLCNSLASSVLLTAKDDEEKLQAVAQSMSDTSALDKLVASSINESEGMTAAYEFMKSIDEETLDAMLKSQQSKRSRCKSKAMSEENYKSLFSAAAAEHIIRLVSGKAKSTGGRTRGTSVEYTEERLAELFADQEALRKEVRNVQSKKSIMKSKADFDENSDRWQSLLTAEEQLKSIRIDRTRQAATPVKIDTLRADLKEITAELDPQSMKTADLKAILTTIKDMVWADAAQDDQVNENDDELNDEAIVANDTADEI